MEPHLQEGQQATDKFTNYRVQVVDGFSPRFTVSLLTMTATSRTEELSSTETEIYGGRRPSVRDTAMFQALVSLSNLLLQVPVGSKAGHTCRVRYRMPAWP